VKHSVRRSLINCGNSMELIETTSLTRLFAE